MQVCARVRNECARVEKPAQFRKHSQNSFHFEYETEDKKTTLFQLIFLNAEIKRRTKESLSLYSVTLISPKFPLLSVGIKIHRIPTPYQSMECSHSSLVPTENSQKPQNFRALKNAELIFNLAYQKQTTGGSQ